MHTGQAMRQSEGDESRSPGVVGASSCSAVPVQRNTVEARMESVTSLLPSQMK